MSYNITGFCEKNRDTLFPDLIVLMQSSSKYARLLLMQPFTLSYHSEFIRYLFPDDPNPVDKHGRQVKAPTASGKIKASFND